MKTGDYYVPYDADGNLMHYPERSWDWSTVTYVDGQRVGNGTRVDPIMRPNDPFAATLNICDMRRGRSAKYLLATDEQGRKFPIFVADLLDIMSCSVIEYGKVSGSWRARKRGQNYGLVKVGE